MAYQVMARKWRPQSFQALVGQDHIATTLLNALNNNRLPQALLFTGVRGTGKTSTARILAKSLRCPNAKNFVPCGVCPACEDIASGRSLDVIEIDGASNNGVDAVRELRDTVGYMPATGTYKVYIIDEVHMLSTSAFNALLKTLEEPPAHVVFILATTEVQKIPNTILSRCQRFDFRRIASRAIAGQLEKITAAEGIKSENEALWLIARQGDGSMRDSQSLLDQVITYSGEAVTLAKTIEVLGLTDRTILLETVRALVARSTPAMIEIVEKLSLAGYDSKVFAQDLLEQLRNALLVKLSDRGADLTKLVDLPDTEIEALAELVASMSQEDIHMLFDMALKGVNDLLRSQDARLVLEMLLLRMSAAPQIVPIAAMLSGSASHATHQATPESVRVTPPIAKPTAVKPAAKRVAAVPLASVAATPLGSVPATPAPARQPEPAPSSEPEKKKFNFVRPANAQVAAAMAAKENAAQAAPHAANDGYAPNTGSADAGFDDESHLTDAQKNDPWFRFVLQVKKSNGLLGAMLENTHVMSDSGSHMILGMPKKVGFLTDKLKDPENIRRIQTFIETFWNKKYTIEVKVDDGKPKKVEAGKSAAAEPLTPKASVERQREAKEKSDESAVESNAVVRSAQDVFKAQIKSIKEQ